MKNKKALIIIIITSVIIITLLYTLNNNKPIDEFNENTNLPFALGLPNTSIVRDEEFQIPGGSYGGFQLVKDDLKIWVSGWPDILDEYHVTSYEFTSDKYSIFGFTNGDYLDNAISTLKKHGYRIDMIPEQSSVQRYIFSNRGVIFINITVNPENEIIRIFVGLETTNKSGAVF